MRTTIFISHAAPEDNAFAVWLAARLTALGYNVWVDKKALIGGEHFWQEIDHVIRNEACKFVLVYSKNICVNGAPGHLKDGISKEMSLAESVAKQNSFPCFTLLLNIDASPYNLFIGSDRFNQIPFDQDWANGLSQLVTRFSKDNLPKPNTGLTDFSVWFNSYQMARLDIHPKRELYYTNLWPLPLLPETFFIYRFQTENDAAFAYQKTFCFPVTKNSNYLASFASLGELQIETPKDSSTVFSVLEAKTSVAITEQDQVPDISGRQLRNCLLHLLSRAFHLLMKERGLYWSTLANKRLAYYYTPKCLDRNKVSFNYPFSSQCKTKHLLGRYKDLGYWHYALSCKPVLSPEPTFALKSHLLFTTDQFTPWDDSAKMHTHRRAKGRHLFNAEWRDLLLAFLEGLVNDDGNIEIDLNTHFVLSMPPSPKLIWSDFGYEEPSTEDNLIALAEESAAEELADTEESDV